ncbi:pirin family protein [uncultured Ferrovibrio sp.]|jgi:redox-sensitive bicupin YhaK (pirin superfamily)|uniref:pirin family protein n=1 Tax=uncultured Ferrovibrio sp. TaxID=1576913 RepID=UPI00261E4954|nr:pirin family protein [uncultured Ferrovibrio sp.]
MSDQLLPDSVDLVITPRLRDLGEGFSVRRILPYARRRHVGPFVFFDHMGPVRFAPGQGLDVRPHPHIGLATITYLFDGEIMHRDSLGVVQPIRPGDVNWMVAGKGIVHSERTRPELRATGASLHGIQSWIALPQADEETDPSFRHHPESSLPEIVLSGVKLRLIAGQAFGAVSPVQTFAPMFYCDAQLSPGASLQMPEHYEERALYVAEGNAVIDGEIYDAGTMLVFKSDAQPQIQAQGAARLMLLGGAPLDGERHLWWNFVSSSKERIERAKRDWSEGRFALVPGETDFIPLPEM